MSDIYNIKKSQLGDVSGDDYINIKRKFLAQLKNQLLEAQKMSKVLQNVKAGKINLNAKGNARTKASRMSAEDFLDFETRVDNTLRELDSFNLKEVKFDNM